jgi:hypothetical protein
VKRTAKIEINQLDGRVVFIWVGPVCRQRLKPHTPCDSVAVNMISRRLAFSVSRLDFSSGYGS